MIGMRGIALFLALVTMGAPATTQAQSWPVKPVRFVVPFAPGGATDVIGRLVADKLGARFGHPVIIENKPGAGGNLGAVLVAKAPADGYTFLVATSHPALMIAPSITKDAGSDPVRDFAPVTLMATQPLLLDLHSSMPPNTVPEFVAYAKARPGQLSYATPGVGSPHHIAMELFKLTTGIDIVHVPYRGGAPATQDVVAGQVPVMFMSYVLAGPHIQTGKLKAIGGSRIRRVTQAPDIPTVAEQGYPDFDLEIWFYLLAPADTPAPAVTRLTKEVQAVLAMPEIRERLLTVGFDPAPLKSTAEFGAMLKNDVAKWAKVIRDANIKLE